VIKADRLCEGVSIDKMFPKVVQNLQILPANGKQAPLAGESSTLDQLETRIHLPNSSCQIIKPTLFHKKNLKMSVKKDCILQKF
jgi:hypothetical protein